MGRVELDEDVTARLEELLRRRGEATGIFGVADVAEGLLETLAGGVSAKDTELYSELESLARYIEDARSEIAALRPGEVKSEHLPKATNELDAIVGATEEATNAIMDATEMVEAVVEQVDGKKAELLMEAVTRIYEACGFQDITGQRITKVVTTLKHIEDKIDALIEVFGKEIEKRKDVAQQTRKEQKPRPPADEDLLNGPQLKGNANTQDDIDALLASSK